MVTDHLTDRMGLKPILSVNVNLMVTETEMVKGPLMNNSLNL